MKVPQRDRILADLRLARPGAVCGNQWLAAYMPRYAAVIWTLRHRDHCLIYSMPCTMHRHEGGVFMYVLVSEPDGAAPQLSWLVGKPSAGR